MEKFKQQHINEESLAPPNYYLTVDDYLKPKTVKKQNPTRLLFSEQTLQRSHQMRLKLLEHPVLIAGRKSKLQLFAANVAQVFKPKIKRNPLKLQENCKRSDSITKIASTWHNKTFNKRTGSIQLPQFLSFLRARNDICLCKRKSGFEIYCEMASIHGFINFVGATTWQRAFWFFVVLSALVMSGFILLLSHFINTSTPTILYSESTQYPSWSIPFPAVTICNLNLISRAKAENLAAKFQKKSHFTLPELTSYFNLALSTSLNIKASSQDHKQLNFILKSNNYTLAKLLDNITPNCEHELLRCKWRGHFIRCKYLFKKIPTFFGQCCSFNYKALQKTLNKHNDDHVEYITSCGYETGLSVLLNPHLEDYQASLTLTPGFQVLIHDSHDYADTATLKRLITSTTFNKLHVLPQQTYATSYVARQSLANRKCYIPNERKLFHFGSYSQVNCLAECRSLIIYAKCGCAMPNWPKMENWTVCDLEQSNCYMKYKSKFVSELKYTKLKRFNEQFICDCYPLCDFNMYSVTMDSGRLMRKFSLTDERFFKDINTTNHILLHVFFDELYAERLRLDVYENWLSFIGTFGGIIGLHMGYSFVSGFELIFFVFVRPACNWLTRKQIRYRIKKRRREAESKKKLEQEKQQQQERIEAFSRMRPHCSDYLG